MLPDIFLLRINPINSTDYCAVFKQKRRITCASFELYKGLVFLTIQTIVKVSTAMLKEIQSPGVHVKKNKTSKAAAHDRSSCCVTTISYFFNSASVG